MILIIIIYLKKFSIFPMFNQPCFSTLNTLANQLNKITNNLRKYTSSVIDSNTIKIIKGKNKQR